MDFTALIQDLQYLVPELIVGVGGMALLLLGVYAGVAAMRLVTTGAVVLLGAAGVAAAFYDPGGPGAAFINEAGQGAFVLDAWARFAKVIIAGLAAAALVISARYLRDEDLEQFEYPVLVVFASLGMMVMVSARDILGLYMGIELQSLSLYVLAAIQRDKVRASEAGLKYFVLGALSSGLLLYGLSLIYGFTGETRFEAIAAAIDPEGTPDLALGVIFGLVFVICGLAFKVSAAPFHMWTPDVYQGAPTSATALFAGAPKFAAMALFARFLLEAFGAHASEWQLVIALIAAASMTVGALGALVQTDLKRLMAYSSIANMGFALVALAAGTERGAQGLLLYMSIYAITVTSIFACILAIRGSTSDAMKITALAGLSRTHPGLALGLTALLFSLAGIPPLLGFFGKLFAFIPAWEAGRFEASEYLRWLVIYAVLASVVTAFYYLRLIKIMWFDAVDQPVVRSTGELALVTAAGALFTSPLILIAAQWLRPAVDGAARALF